MHLARVSGSTVEGLGYGALVAHHATGGGLVDEHHLGVSNGALWATVEAEAKILGSQRDSLPSMLSSRKCLLW